MMTLDPEQRSAQRLMLSGSNVFLTGSAGTGKSTVTTAFILESPGQAEVLATTGIAAINLRDQIEAKTRRALNVMTVYRWAGIGLGPRPGQTNEEFWDWWRRNIKGPALGVIDRIRRASIIIIDEISMLPGRILNYLDFHLRKIRGDEAPFGGIQVVAVGDFLQLPPVDKSGEGYDWAFRSSAWANGQFVPACLTTVHRQDEREFVDLLNAFRFGEIPSSSLDILGERVTIFPASKIPRLFTHNVMVDKWNNAQLAGIDGRAMTYSAGLAGPEKQQESLVKNMITPRTLELKKGARVMVTANITIDGKLVASNGTIGTVVGFVQENYSTPWPVIVTDDGKTELTIRPNRWNYDAQDKSSATFTQVPLRLAWATTIHKAQGLTLPAAYIDIRAAREPGQAYVAISRVKTLAGLHLKAIPSGVFVSRAAVEFQRNALSFDDIPF